MVMSEDLDRASAQLRSKLAPLPADRALAAWKNIPYPPHYTGAAPPKACEEYLQQRALSLGNIKGDGRCQFAAVSRAAFGTTDYAEELCRLAVEYLRENKAAYEESMQAYLIERKDALDALSKAKKIPAPDYDGYLKAIEQNLEWGNDQTLLAMAILMHLEVRVLDNLPCNPSAKVPRLHPVPIAASRGHVGVMSSVIYLFLQDKHYRTLENGAAPLPAPEAARSLYSVRSGSVRTASDDVTCDVDEFGDMRRILVAGEEYSANDLRCGVSLGEGMRLIMEPSGDGREWIIFREHVHVGCRDEARRLKRTVTKGTQKSRKLPPTTPAPLPPARAESGEPKDIESWLLELKHTGWRATPMVAQRLFECMGTVIKELELELFRGANDGTQLGLLSSELLPVYEELRRIKYELQFTASAHSLPIQTVMFIGISGAGKSTTINRVIAHCWNKSDDPTEALDVVEEVFRAQSQVLLPATVAAEEEKALAVAREDDDVCFRFDLGPEDILPAGRGAAMTALPTVVFFDPSAAHVVLHLTYRPKPEVLDVLEYAKMIHDDVDDEMPYDDVKAAQAVNLLGLGRGASNTDGTDAASSVAYDDDEDADEAAAAEENAPVDAVELIKEYNGAFALPERFTQLLGPEPTKRQFTIKGGDWQEVAKKVQELMLVHTIGHWSHWPVLEKIEVSMPSVLEAPLRAVDVPGFGDELLDPFRQSIVDEQLKKPASTLCLVLKHDRLEDNAATAFARLDRPGTSTVDDLLALPTQRRIGKLMTLAALDWAVEAFFKTKRDGATAKKCIEKEHAKIVKDSGDWLKKKLSYAVKTKTHGNEKIGQTEKQLIKDRVNQTMENAVQPSAIDVRSCLEEHDVDKTINLHIKDLVLQLLKNNEANQRRLQEALLHKLISQCLLPLYTKLDQICKLRELVGKGNDDRLQPLDEQPLLRGVRQEIANWLSTTNNTNRVQQLRLKVLNPKKNACTDDGIKQRWSTMERYSKPHSHKLGADLKSRKPEETLLPDLMIKPLAVDAMLPLQEELREMLLEMTEKPAKELRNIVLGIMSQRLQVNIDAAPELEQVLRSAWSIAETGLVDGVRQIIDYFRKLLEVRICSLRDTLPSILHDVLIMEELDLLARNKKFPGNEKKRDELARKTMGGNGVAHMVELHLCELVKTKIFAKFDLVFTDRFEKLVRYSTGVIENALKGNVKELEQLNGFAVAFKTARETAGIIKAVYESKVAPRGFEHLEENGTLNSIIQLADAPIGLVVSSGAGKDFAQLSGAVVAADDEVDSVGGSGAGTGSAQLSGAIVEADDEWRCSNCFVRASDTDLTQIAKFDLMPAPCAFEPNCFCEQLDRDATYCRLCVRYFGKKHTMRPLTHERARRYQYNKRRLSAQAAPQAGKKRCLAQPQSPVSTHQMQNVEEI